jgi:hypothetical protein
MNHITTYTRGNDEGQYEFMVCDGVACVCVYVQCDVIEGYK